MRECERKVFLYSGYTDMRLGIYGLIRKIGKPENGGCYAFCGKNRKTVKILEYHGHYVWLHMKRVLIDRIDIINRVELKKDKTLHTF